MKAIILGAGGLTGGQCLKLLLQDTDFQEVESWSRKSIEILHPKLKQKVFDFSEIQQQNASGVDVAFCCLGSTIKKSGSQERFREIDHDYVVELAKIAETFKIPKLIIISSIGADSNSRNFYLKTKGEMENDVFNLQIPSIIILRPSILLGKRNEFRLGEIIGQFIMKGLGVFFFGKLRRYKGISAEKVAKAMISLAKQDIKGKIFLESEEIQQLA